MILEGNEYKGSVVNSLLYSIYCLNRKWKKQQQKKNNKQTNKKKKKKKKKKQQQKTKTKLVFNNDWFNALMETNNIHLKHWNK